MIRASRRQRSAPGAAALLVVPTVLWYATFIAPLVVLP
jgi:hypothetical protein